MTTLYNCRHAGDQYRITKFDTDMNVESSYLCDALECDCPAGVRPTCRHREMVPMFIKRQHVGDEWMFDYDRGGWVQMGLEWAQPSAAQEDQAPMPLDLALAILPEGVTMVSLDDPATLHNTIAEAVGEPQTITMNCCKCGKPTELTAGPPRDWFMCLACVGKTYAQPEFMKRRFL